MIASKSYVSRNTHGVLRIGETRVSLDSVVYAFLEGHAPETIQDQYPALTLEEVYGALAFYLSNRPEVDDYLRLREQFWQKARERAEQTPSSVWAKLRAAKDRLSRENIP